MYNFYEIHKSKVLRLLVWFGSRLGFATLLISFATDAIQAQQAENPASAQIISDTVETNLTGVRAYRVTPKNFDAETASDSELARYGLPAKPDSQKSPQAFKVWEDLVQASHERVIPQLTKSNIYHRPIKNIRAGKRLSNGSMTNDIWSGFVINDPSNIFNQSGTVAGYYTVPGVDVCFVLHSPRLWSSHWVGIDGYGTPDVLQVGTSSDQDCYPGLLDYPQYYAWVEWFPNAALIADKQVPIVPGDSMFVAVTFTPASGLYQLTLRNFTRHVAFTMPMTPPPGTKLIGNSIEWVIERPEVNGIQTNLALYTQSAWQKMFGYFPKSGALYRPSALPSGVLTTLIMDQNGIYVSIPTLYPGESDDAAWFNGIRVPLP